MTTADRKAAVDAYKQRKVVGGIYSITCEPTGARWVGAANELHGVKNRIWFTLNLGRSPWPELEAAWKKHGAEAFTFAEVERLEDDLKPYERDIALKERRARWQEKLAASPI